MATNPHIRGLSETLEILRKFEPEAYKEMQRRMKGDAKPMLETARSRLPPVPLSNWNAGRAKQQDVSGFKTLRGGSVGDKTGFPVYVPRTAQKRVKLSLRNQKLRGTQGGRRVVLRMISDDASAMIFDRAGKKTSTQFSTNLSRKWGSPMRALWPAAEQHQPQLVASIKAALRDQEKETSRKLR